MEPTRSGLVKTQEYKWQDIKSISYRDFEFELQPHQNQRHKSDMPVVYTFHSPDDSSKCKYIFRLASDCHKFQLDCRLKDSNIKEFVPQIPDFALFNLVKN